MCRQLKRSDLINHQETIGNERLILLHKSLLRSDRRESVSFLLRKFLYARSDISDVSSQCDVVTAYIRELKQGRRPLLRDSSSKNMISYYCNNFAITPSRSAWKV